MESNLGNLATEEEPKRPPDKWGRSQRWWRDKFTRHLHMLVHPRPQYVWPRGCFQKSQSLQRAVLLSFKKKFLHLFNVHCKLNRNLTAIQDFARQGTNSTKEIVLSQVACRPFPSGAFPLCHVELTLNLIEMASYFPATLGQKYCRNQ